MKRWLHEPLLHFLVAGALLFALYGWINRDEGNEPRGVRLTTADVTWLKESWARQWHRQPSPEELRGLVSDYLKEALLAREAKDLGLDENDTIIRRRLAQKMEFLVQDTARVAEPDEAALRQFHAAHPARYQTPGRITFTQLFFKTEPGARQGLDALRAGTAAPELGDPSLIERDYAQADEGALASVFGPVFARQISGLAPGPWQGPVASSYGFHLVKISERQAAQAQTFDQARPQILDDWQRDQQALARARFFADMLKKYDVSVDDSIKALVEPLLPALK